MAADANLAPIGIPGELYLGGPKVARGYIGRPDLTTTSFVQVASLPEAGRLYKTGDRVRWLEDGNLEFLGRVDFQIKLNGQRIEVGEIESVLRQVKGVRDAMVMVRQTPAGVSRLVAYVLAREGEKKKLMEACESQLPSYMVPSVVVCLEEWPLNANGKVDRRVLPEPEWGGHSSHQMEPRTRREVWVVQIVEEVLQVDSVGVDTDLLLVGLTSLLAVRVSSLLASRHSLTVASSSIMQHRVVSKIAAVVQSGESGQALSLIHI